VQGAWGACFIECRGHHDGPGKRNLRSNWRGRAAAHCVRGRSDLPLFLVGGTVLEPGRGEQVIHWKRPAQLPCVIATPDVGVSTPAAFADWDKKNGQAQIDRQQNHLTPNWTDPSTSDRIDTFSRTIYDG